MPPRLQALQKTLSLEVFQGPSLVHHRYETTTLTRIRSWRAQWLPDCQPAPRVRHASTVTPATVVNAAKVVPSQVRGVYEALEVLQKDAGVYTSLSQLQLALRGLESENPVTRIAVSSLDGFSCAQRLVRVLLADPLRSEAPWEQRLLEIEDTDERALLIRYGDKVDYDQKHPLLRTLTIPAASLHTHNLELLIQPLPPSDETNTYSTHAYLVPSLEIVSSQMARHSIIRYPVHKALVYSEGLRNLSIYRAITSTNEEEKAMIRGVTNTSWSNLTEPGDGAVAPINVDRAEAAINTFRQSLENSIKYEHVLFDSGLPSLANWVFENSPSASTIVKPTIRRLINTIVNVTEDRILTEETEQLRKAASNTILPTTRSSLTKLLTAWSENAHTELRDQLDFAFASSAWRKLAWWQLPWRVDDVAMITADVLHRSWLTDAEKELIWVAGRVEQAGLFAPNQSKAADRELVQRNEEEPMEVRQAAIFSASVPAPSIVSLIPDLAQSEAESSLTATSKPYPQGLAQARCALVLSTSPSLQGIAQRLLAQSLSVTILTSSLSALMYFSISTTSIYESGTIAALGVVYSLRRLQHRWEEVRGSWKEGIKERGRIALRVIEKHWREIINEGGKQESDKNSLNEREKARDAVARVRSALDASDT